MGVVYGLKTEEGRAVVDTMGRRGASTAALPTLIREMFANSQLISNMQTHWPCLVGGLCPLMLER